MRDFKWEENPDWRNLQTPGIGDIVHLKETKSFRYLVKAIVLSVKNDTITLVVDSVFDLDNTDCQIKGGMDEILVLKGKKIPFEKKMIHNVIKKTNC